jgi:hypothetical protein
MRNFIIVIPKDAELTGKITINFDELVVDTLQTEDEVLAFAADNDLDEEDELIQCALDAVNMGKDVCIIPVKEGQGDVTEFLADRGIDDVEWDDDEIEVLKGDIY